ncbi:MAG: MarR family transcriptional regulator [SAR202 cluster bacterium]|nr:MarR family transcriptional regulator [SAR202 cluster bacterium]
MTMKAESSTDWTAQDHLGYWVGTLGSAMRKGLEDELAPMGVRPGQWGILEAALSCNADTLTALARIIPVDAAAISRQLDKLQQRRLVRRRLLRSDHRMVRIELTAPGLLPPLPQLLVDGFRLYAGGG